MAAFRFCIIGLAILAGVMMPFDQGGLMAHQGHSGPGTPQYRPAYHYTPRKNWINDPNGLVYYNGEYHLFYQYNPYGDKWGNMSWGHAVSRDLSGWTELPVALKPDKLGMIFSGAVVDRFNTSGLFKGKEGGLVAIYTNHGETEQQSIAYSTDNGRTWIKYAGNPVIPNPGLKDFRDPKVLWHEPSGKWVMLLAAGEKIMFYSSPDLKEWTHMSDFVPDEKIYGKVVWEVPDLFELEVNGDPARTKWVLKADHIPEDVEESQHGLYFVGQFDGFKFVSDNPSGTKLDHGMDFYAANSWANIPERTIWIAWMNNWKYAEAIPTNPWRGAMTIPREVRLADIPGQGIRLVQSPVRELQRLRREKREWSNLNLASGEHLIAGIKGTTLEIIAEFERGTAEEFGILVRKGKKEQTVIGYRTADSSLYVDRTNSGKTDFSKDFPGVYTASHPLENNRLKLHIFVDRSSVELFANDGKTVLTNQIFPELQSDRIALFSVNGEAKLRSLTVYELHAALHSADD